MVAALDELEVTFGEGPCAEAALHETIVRSDGLRAETRRPRLTPSAVHHGVLNVFDFTAGMWQPEAETVGSVLPAHAAAAILAGWHVEQMQTALSTGTASARPRASSWKATAWPPIVLSRCCGSCPRKST